MRTRRLTVHDRAQARTLFALLTEVFGEETHTLSDDYLERLLSQPSFYAVAALEQEEVIGGLTAHAIAMTRSESSELFIYDVAVSPRFQRRGVGRALVATVLSEAAVAGIHQAFVLVDRSDTHALRFYNALKGTSSPVTLYAWETGR